MSRSAFVTFVCCGLSFSPLSLVAAPVSWVNGSGGDWLAPSNWSSNPALPSFIDQVTISQPGTLTITLSGSAPEINSLSMSENLLITTPSDLVVGSGGGSISGTIDLQNGRLISKTGTLNILNTVNSDVSGLRASAGGNMLFSPGVLSTINGRSDNRTTLESDGTSSLLDLSGVTTFTGGGFFNAVLAATSGGTIEMENVASMTSGATYIEANGANSQIALNALTTFSRSITTDFGELRAINGGTLITPNLTTLSNHIAVRVSGATSSIGLSNVTSANTVSFYALDGGVVPLNSLTSYIADSSGSTFQADGTGSKLDLSPLTTFNGGTFNNSKLIANNGGIIELENVTSLNTGAFLIDATNSATINLSALTTFTRTNFADTARLRAAGGGSILTSSLTTLGPVLVEIDGAASSINLSNLTSVDSTSFTATNGGTVAPAVLATYNAGSTGSSLIAIGATSLVDLSSLTNFSGGTFNRTNVVAAGGRVEIDNVTQIVNGSTNVEANDGGRVVLTDLTTFSRTNNADLGRLRAANGGIIESPNLTTLGPVNIEISGATSVVDLDSLTSVDTTSFLASNGGVITAPALTGYSAGSNGSVLRADVGSLIDLSSVTTFAGGTFNNTDVYAVGGTIDLGGVTTMVSGGTDVRATSGGHIDFASLATFAPTNNADAKVILADTNGSIQFRTAGKTTVTNTEMFLNTGGEMHGQEIELGAGTNFQATGTVQADLSNTAGSLRPGFNNQIGELEIEGDFKQGSSGQLRIEASSVLQYDAIDIDGDASLGGNLHITPLAGFTPVYGTGIDIINTTGSISGVFNTITWDGLFGWRVEYLPNVVRLLAQFGADFDEDGDVDGDDLLTWQNNYGMNSADHEDGDADDDGDVDGRDFLVWQRQFTGALPVVASTSVPEPSAIYLALIAVVSLFQRKKPLAH